MLYAGLQRSLSHEDDLFLGHLITIVRDLIAKHPEDSPEVHWEIESEWAARDLTRVYVRLVDLNGRVTAQTPGMGEQLPLAGFPPPTNGIVQPGDGRDVRSPRGRPFRAIAGPAKTREGDERIVQVALDQTLEKAHLARYLRRVWIVLALAVVVSSVIGYFLARQSIKPVRQITDAARRVRSTTLHERIAPAGLPAELWALAATFNEMLDRLEEAFTRLSQFSADIAHELRTPVNNLRGEAEVALSKARTPEEYRHALESSLEESGRLGSTIEALLFLARSENPQTQVRRERVDLVEEIERAREFYEPAAAENGITLAIERTDGDARAGATGAAGETPIEAALDRTLLQRAVYNLLDNALAHTPSGGRIVLSVLQENARVTIAVRDSGCGIAPEHLPRVFDRFYRCDRSRTAGAGGAGLGLAIVQTIVRLHGGSARIASPPAGGTEVALTFPVVTPNA
ncbi:MAG: two-component system, OmpR family, heavy metal sensor histidine kinase CusS [Phycisphaerales bacterium]|jgi:two-component system heavy metal sensor histidine kinase CusS|nr:two-component system, OmpR family, heavy metal sensor histidine kinase CusS [Phycisphaerales bacterium]